jgi:hypothetical protein
MPGGGMMGRTGDAPQLFYSRRIGLDRGRVIPIQAGGRIAGKVGKYGIGLMSVQTGEEAAASAEGTNFTVIRVKRDILRRSSIGALFTNRTALPGSDASNQAYGVDLGLAFFTNLSMDAYYARTETSGRVGDDASWKGGVDYAGDRYGARAEYLKVGDAFSPEIGFLRRSDFGKWSGSLRFSPRPTNLPPIRRLSWEGEINYFEDGQGSLESREQLGRFSLELNNSDLFTLQFSRNFERLDDPFPVGSGVSVAPGRYGFGSLRASYMFGLQRRVSGTLSITRGDFYNGSVTSVGVSGGRVVVTDHLSLEPGVTINRIELPQGKVEQNLLRTRADYAFTARMFASALVQYSSADHTFGSNLRFRWEYRPGSELFVVWTDERDTSTGGTGLRNRALALKATRLLRF